MALQSRSLLLLAMATSAAAGLTVVPSGGPTVDVEGAVAMGKRCCGTANPHVCPGHVPDIPARCFVKGSASDGGVQMIVGSTSYFPMSGPSPLNQTRSCKCSFNKTADGNPAHFDADEYPDSPIAFDNGTVVALVHTEFPGNKFNMSGGPNEPYCTGPGYPNCWAVGIGLVISHDWGATFAHVLPPPHHLVAAVPYKYRQDQLASGWGDPSNIILHPTDGHYYAAIWNRHQVGLQAPGICMMRTNHLLDPASWRAWDGKAYTKAFANPYTLEVGTEADHVCTVTNLPAGSVEDGCAAHGLSWSEYLQQFVVTLGCDQARTPVFKYAVSDDLIVWSNASTLMTMAQAKNLSRFGPGGQSTMVHNGINYPTFIDPASKDRNFGVIGQRPYLFWVSKGDNPEDIGRHLLATPFTFEK
eukprot:SAG22_NODE_1170_length_5261_cov_96.345796_4_plen_414_part_00